MHHGLHHIRTRACVTEGLEPFPARTLPMRLLDYVMYGVAFVAPLALLPQILQIYGTKSSEGVSLLTWSLLTLSNILWTVYAMVHKDKHLFFASAFVIVFHLTIVIGLLIY
ncbi:MAG: SemiSWEET family transporter [Candidatus Kaiserbacteria bacterium]|nr:SemiSWEET family transporter [Candidatus Kaiserbacteria bacterium]